MTDTLIGRSLLRPDAYGKVTGAARYPADLVEPGMLHLAAAYAHRPHARILAIDTAAALAAPGTVAVLTAADVPHNAFGLISADQPLLCGETVRFAGDRVALVVAETREQARAAAALIAVSYEDLPAVTDAEAALLPGSPLVHPAHGSNIVCHCPIRKGDAARALAQADVVLTGEYVTSWQEHAFLQPEAGVAWVEDDGRLIVETAGQWLHEDRRQIASLLGLPEERVVVRYAAIGGAFGGREDLTVQPLLALAAFRLGRKVAMVWSREESMTAHHKRHPMTVRCRWGAMRDGRIVAVQAEVIADGGAYASTSQEVIKCAALFASGCYEVPNISVDGYALYTNNIPSGAFRGFGAPQAQFASECMVTRLAHELGMDPLEMRRINLYRDGSVEPTQDVLPPGVTVRECLDAVVAAMPQRLAGQNQGTDRIERGNQPERTNEPTNQPERTNEPTNQPEHSDPTHGDPAWPWQRGVGIACGIKNLGYSFGYPEKASASVELYGQAAIDRAVVRVGAAEVGQGTSLIMRQIAAETLGVSFEQVTMVMDDSAEAPSAGSASASRLTIMAGRAVKDTCEAALAEWAREERPARASFTYRAPATTELDHATTAGRPNYAYGYAAQGVELEVNELTGEVRLLRIVSAHDVGRAINMQQVEGQIVGGVVQALGYALMEEFKMRDGQMLTPGFSTYQLPTALDVPEIVPLVLELGDAIGPYGARGMAELPLVPLTPAIAAAIHDAVGVWVSRQPITAERVLDALVSGHFVHR